MGKWIAVGVDTLAKDVKTMEFQPLGSVSSSGDVKYNNIIYYLYIIKQRR